MAQTIELESISEKMVPYFQSGSLNFLIGSGASAPAIALAGSIEKDINSLLLDHKDGEADLLALEFIESLESDSSNLSAGIGSEYGKTTLENYLKFIKAIDSILFERKSTLLARQATIFTTNYDTFVEHAVSMIPAVILNDGFDRTSPNTSEFRFAPEQFFDRTFRSGTVYSRQSEIPTINLVKLHGSLNWKRTEKEIRYSVSAPSALGEDDRKDASKVRLALEKRALILPRMSKFRSVLLDRVYYDQLRMFATKMEAENSLLVVFGFSFSDDHILDITKRTLRNPTAQMIIFAYDDNAVELFQILFMHHRNVLVVKPEQGKKIDFGAFNNALESVLTADGELNGN